VAPSEIIPRIRKLVERTKKLEQQAAKGASVSKDDVRSGIKDVNGVRVIAKKVDVLDHSALRNIADQYKQIIGSGVVVVGSEINGKVALIVIVSKDLTDKHNAGNLVKKISAAVGGTGGGRPDMAQGGGPDLDKLDESLKLVEELI